MQVLFPIEVCPPTMELSNPSVGPTEGDTWPAADERQALRLWLRLLSCTHRMEQALGQRLRQHFGTSLARFDYLAQLHLYPEGLRMKALSRQLMVTGGNVTGLTDQLIAEGHVTRQVDLNDRRSHIVRMTPQGLTHFERMAQAHRLWVDVLLSGVSPSEQRQLHRLLGGLARSLDAWPGDAGGIGDATTH